MGVSLGIYAGYRPGQLGLQDDHGYLCAGLFGAVILGRTDPDPDSSRSTLAGCPQAGRGETVEIWGVAWSFPTLNGLSHIVLPAVNLALFKLAMMIRLARAGTREIMLTDTIKFARAAGLSEGTILRRHLLKLISIPIITVFGLELGSTLAFAVVTETIFSWPGVGKLIIDSIGVLDRPVMVAYLILVAFLFVTINFVIDLVFAVIDPRLRQGATA